MSVSCYVLLHSQFCSIYIIFPDRAIQTFLKLSFNLFDLPSTLNTWANFYRVYFCNQADYFFGQFFVWR